MTDVYEDLNEKGGLLNTDTRIGTFRGTYGFLSNMYDCPVTYNGVTYSSNEVAYQAARCAKESDRIRFVGLKGVEAKKLAKKLAKECVPRSDWHDINLSVMEEIVRAKFTQNPKLGKLLAETGDKLLAEGNWWGDSYWGVYRGQGENHLGKILMKVRSELQQKKENVNEQHSTSPQKKDAVFTIAVTGHRPHLMFGYDWKNKGNQLLSARIKKVLLDTLRDARKQGYQQFRLVTGMALGTDQMFAYHGITISRTDEFKDSLTVEAAIPFKGQESKWNQNSQKLYWKLVDACQEKKIVSDGGFTPRSMQVRNEYMVNKANILLSVYDGKSFGGTKNCIDYAKRKGVPVKDVGLQSIFQQVNIEELAR